jgi:glycine hydroxymethyltransferase
LSKSTVSVKILTMADQEITRLIKLEEKRQAETLMLIPSENYSSRAVREAAGSILVHKYAEGYPGKRYYQGNKIIDEIETLAINRAKKLFGVPHVNVQPYSGSPANMAVYFACCNPGDTVMGMDLTAGGHLTHGWKVNFSGMLYKSIQYTTDKNGWLDYEEIEELAQKYRPKIIWAGATAYPRFFDWEKFGKIADSINALFAADIAHYAGLIVGGVYPSPVPFTHVITTTTHKTLRGPRAALILVTEKGLKKDHDLPQKIDRAVFPGLQGGPHENTIAALAVALAEASRPSFKNYAQQVVENAKILAEELKKQGFNLVTGGTDNHLILSDLSNLRIDGKNAAVLLEKAGLVVNANSIPHDPNPPFRPSGIRLGTPAVTTRGMGKEEMVKEPDGWC